MELEIEMVGAIHLKSTHQEKKEVNSPTRSPMNCETIGFERSSIGGT
jgi:hypothetical protein